MRSTPFVAPLQRFAAGPRARMARRSDGSRADRPAGAADRRVARRNSGRDARAGAIAARRLARSRATLACVASSSGSSSRKGVREGSLDVGASMNVVAARIRPRWPEMLRGLGSRPKQSSPKSPQILADVRARGDAAIIEYARRFDDERFDFRSCAYAIPMLEGARSLVSREIAAALEVAQGADRAFSRAPAPCRPMRTRKKTEPDTRLQRAAAAIGCDLRAGGQREPRRFDGRRSGKDRRRAARRRALARRDRRRRLAGGALRVRALCGVDEFYAVGGAQAIGAAAFGTESIGAGRKDRRPRRRLGDRGEASGVRPMRHRRTRGTGGGAGRRR